MTRLNRSITSLLGIGVLSLAVTAAQAHEPNRNDTAYQGYRNGEITKKEQKKLRKQRKHVNRMRNRAVRDGRVTRKEAKKIDKAENKLARQQARAMNNDVSRNDRRYNRDERWSRNDRNDWWNNDRWDNNWWNNDRWDNDRWDNNRQDYHRRHRTRRDHGQRAHRDQYGWYGQRQSGQRTGSYGRPEAHHHHRDRRDRYDEQYSRRDWYQR